ncbi:hypothetical protein [Caloramator australicus]|uniref:Uncharacterized protein n=1 Tax=Caloramator australicus RC3 TaxID=857293 RepID=I7LH32_9CLOT|nr:hypothetical protein [Caloramator australicus]CCJ33730.1 hypothetical protein CAAU_1646 [Caloramator australicus RC3]
MHVIESSGSRYKYSTYVNTSKSQPSQNVAKTSNQNKSAIVSSNSVRIEPFKIGGSASTVNSKQLPKITFDSSPFNPTKAPGSSLANVASVATTSKYIDAYVNDGFTVKKAGDYAIIKGAKTSSAIEEGIKGTRYAIKNAEKYPQVFKFIDPKVAVKESFNMKTVGGKLGVISILADTGIDVYSDIKNKASATKITADVAVDVAFGAGNIAASAAFGAWVGSVAPGPGNVIGAAAGVLFGMGYTAITESFKYNGTSIKDASKNGLNNLLDKVTN